MNRRETPARTTVAATSRAALLLMMLIICGCGVQVGYFSGDAEQTWPDSYYYAALRADARQWQAANVSDAGLATRTASQGLILADLPFSIIADTAVLPVLLCTSAALALRGPPASTSSAIGEAPQASMASGQP